MFNWNFRRERNGSEIFEEIIIENFSESLKNNLQIQAAQSILTCK